jgi:hypothetical protein
MTKIYSYIIRIDDGAAPNPYWGTCTLAICKPAIRRTAEIGDWVIGTGSKNSALRFGGIYDLADSLVYAMKISDIKTMAEYDTHCQQSLKKKIPNWKSNDFRRRMGDCIYDYSKGIDKEPVLREGVHIEGNRNRDLGGVRVLLSTHFYYFGEEARPLPQHLKPLIKINQGHRKITDENLIIEFEKWIGQFEPNKIYADPQLKFKFETDKDNCKPACATEREKDDRDEREELC